MYLESAVLQYTHIFALINFSSERLPIFTVKICMYTMYSPIHLNTFLGLCMTLYQFAMVK